MGSCIYGKKLLKICMKCAGEEDAMEAVKSLHESIQVFIVGDCVYIRSKQKQVLDLNFLLSSLCVLKLLDVVRVCNFLFPRNRVIIKKVNYYFRKYKEN